MTTLNEFIEKNIESIEDRNYSEVYLNTLLQELPCINVGELTTLLSSIGEQPLDYMRHIPDYFLYGQPITQFDIPNRVFAIHAAAFSRTQLTSIHIPGHIVAVGDEAFSRCTNLTSVKLDEGVLMLGRNVFRKCPITKIDLPNSIADIGSACFGQTNLQQCSLPNITVVPDFLFAYCSYLTEVVIPSSVTKIGDSVFAAAMSLERIMFEGTLDDWYKIDRHESWNKRSFVREVICSDGVDQLSR